MTSNVSLANSKKPTQVLVLNPDNESTVARVTGSATPTRATTVASDRVEAGPSGFPQSPRSGGAPIPPEPSLGLGTDKVWPAARYPAGG